MLSVDGVERWLWGRGRLEGDALRYRKKERGEVVYNPIRILALVIHPAKAARDLTDRWNRLPGQLPAGQQRKGTFWGRVVGASLVIYNFSGGYLLLLRQRTATRHSYLEKCRDIDMAIEGVSERKAPASDTHQVWRCIQSSTASRSRHTVFVTPAKWLHTRRKASG